MASPRGETGPEPEDERAGHQQEAGDGAPSGGAPFAKPTDDGEDGQAQERGDGSHGQHRVVGRPAAVFMLPGRHVLEFHGQEEGRVAELFMVEPQRGIAWRPSSNLNLVGGGEKFDVMVDDIRVRSVAAQDVGRQ